MTYIEDGAVVLFQGDSITDCGRNRSEADSLGSGLRSDEPPSLGATIPVKR